MRYFFIKQDMELSCAIQYRDFDITGGRHIFARQDAKKLNDSVVLYLKGSGREARWDFLQCPVTMFDERFKEILEAYEPGLFFQDVVFIHKENLLQYQYVHTLMGQVGAASDKTEYYPNGAVRRLVLDQRKISRHNIFLLAGNHRKDPVVSLALAESLLRRQPIGICFEEVEVE